jgi:hypothetical protein
VYPGYRPRRRWLRWILVYCGAVLALAVIGLVIEAAMSHGPRQPQTFSPVVPTPPWASSARPAVTSTHPPKPSASPSPPLDGPLEVVQGRELVNGVYLGFPHSTAGAVSAADDVVSEVFSTLDPDRAAAVMRLTAGPSYGDAPQQAAQGAASDRRALGIPATGPVPAGYSLLVQPVEYQARDVTADHATVLLLCDFTSTQPGNRDADPGRRLPRPGALGAGRLEGRVLRHQQRRQSRRRAVQPPGCLARLAATATSGDRKCQ